MKQNGNGKRDDGPSSAVRMRVFKRDRFTCVYCGISGQNAELEVDHIIAVANGGSHHISNLATCCRACNQKKGTGTLSRKPNSKTATNQTHGLVGLFLHTLKDGEINNQGRIRSVDDGLALVQLYSFFDGRPTVVIPMALADVYACDLYSSEEEWVRAYCLWCKKKGLLNKNLTVDDVIERHFWMKEKIN